MKVVWLCVGDCDNFWFGVGRCESFLATCEGCVIFMAGFGWMTPLVGMGGRGKGSFGVREISANYGTNS